jgi:antitoxin YefM
MRTATVTEFRSKAKEILQKLEDDRDFLVISRPKNKESFVVLPMDEYNSLKETAHLMSTPANTMRLMKGLKQAEEGKVMIKKINLAKRPSKVSR